MASSNVNGASKDLNGSYSKAANSSSTSNKATFAQKMLELKSSEEEAAQKRASQPQKAWTGVNPITQKPNSQANGTVKSTPKVAPNSTGLSKSLLERHNWVWNMAVGAQCIVSTNSNDTFSGIFSGLQKAKDSNLQQFYFKMVKNQSQEYVGQGSEHAMVFSTTDIASIEIPEGQAISRQVNGSSRFRTDVDISGNLGAKQRHLQKWEAPAGSIADGGLESGNNTSGGWDQFKANERLFGLTSDYDENIYTTTINRNDPEYSLREREAARIAREIEGSTSNNAHVREERGLDDSGLDEETKYSGVTRDHELAHSSQPGRYVPPSRRSQAPAANEPFVDPAIISAQVGRPKSENKQEKVAEVAKETAVESEITSKADVKPTEPAVPQKLTTKDTKSVVSEKPAAGQPSATANVENELLDSFKQFSAMEKIRFQDHKRNKASQDKAVKLNDLKKFSQNFKLCTPVPKDLIPILAKDEAKQKALVEKAQKNADTVKPSENKSSLMDPKTQKPLAVARWANDGPVGDQSKLKGVPIPSGQMPKAPQTTKPTTGLSARLYESHRNHKVTTAIPPQLPLQTNIPPAGPSTVTSPTKAVSMRGPPSATSAKFNVKAMEFRPNPNASTFKPSVSLATTVVDSSRSGSVTRNASPAHIPAKLFGEKKPSAKEHQNALVASKAKKSETSTSTQNSGFNPPYRAFPTWVAPPASQGMDGDKGEEDVKYYQAFDKWRARQVQTNTASPINPAAHQHQLPFHLQNGAHPVPQVHTPQPIPHAVPGHQHQFSHQPHFDDHHMRPSASNSSAYPAPSPRMHNTNMAYQASVPPQGQMYGGPIQYVIPGPTQMGGRQYSNGPHPMASVPQGHLAPMMVQQHSQSGYMPQPMAVPYGIVYTTQSPGYPPAQHQNGYPSPGRQAPMMMQSGSHQGHQAQFVPAGQYAQPMYSPQPPNHVRGGFGSPQPGFAQQPQQYQQHYPHQPRRTPSAGYGHPHQMQHAPQPSQMNAPMDEDAK